MNDGTVLSIRTEEDMTGDYKKALMSLLLQMGDDDLIFGHRSSEWLGVAPDLEEDIAFSSISQDEIGHAALFYTMLESLSDGTADSYAFSRNSTERQNARLLELDNGDWAYTIVRAYLYNAFEHVRLHACLNSTYVPLQQAAVKILREERYHLLHMQTWFEKLALAQGKARRRLQQSLLEIWGITGDLFDTGAHAQALVRHGILPLSASQLYTDWKLLLKPAFDKAEIELPKEPSKPASSGRLGHHHTELDKILRTMTEVSRLDVQAAW